MNPKPGILGLLSRPTRFQHLPQIHSLAIQSNRFDSSPEVGRLLSQEISKNLSSRIRFKGELPPATVVGFKWIP